MKKGVLWFAVVRKGKHSLYALAVSMTLPLLCLCVCVCLCKVSVCVCACVRTSVSLSFGGCVDIHLNPGGLTG